MANVSYDTLTIQINADSKSANKSISNLSKNLRNLEKTAQNADYKAIERVQKLLQDISLIDFTNVATGLKSVVMAFKTLENTSARTKSNIDSIDTEKLSSLAKDMKNTDPTWSKKDIPQFKVPDNIPMAQYYDYDFNSVSLQKAVKTSNEWLLAFKKIKKVLDEIRHPIKTIKAQLGIVQRQVDKATNKWINAFKRIAFYRMIRRLIQMITQAIKESMQALAEYSPEFNKAIGEIKSSFRNLANSIIIILAPILQVIAPIIETINHALVDLNNTIASAFGGSEVIQATKNVEDYTDALKKAKSTSLGIDELNVISQDDNSNFFETIKQTDTGFMDTFKEGFSDILEVVKTIVGYVKEFANTILPIIRPIVKEIFRLVSSIMDVVDIFINDTADSVNSSLASFVSFIGQIVEFVTRLVQSLMPTIKSFLKVIAPILNIINNIIEMIFKYASWVLNIVNDVIPVIELALVPLNAILNVVATIFYFIQAIIETIKDLFTLNWGAIPEVWSKASLNMQNLWTDFANETAQSPSNAISGVVNEQNALFHDINFDTKNADIGQATSGNSITSPISYTSSSSSGSQETIVNVYLDSREIAKQVEIVQKNKGASTFSSEGLSYGK